MSIAVSHHFLHESLTMKIKISFIKSGLLLLLLPLLAFAHGISEEDKQRMLDGGYLQYVGLGASHMLTGYDHLLFFTWRGFFLKLLQRNCEVCDRLYSRTLHHTGFCNLLPNHMEFLVG